MTLADGGKFGEKEQRWEDEDVDLTASGTVGEDVVVELKLSTDECQEQLQFTLLRGDAPMPSDRYQIQTRGNVVQLTLKQSQKDDAGRYALVARKLSTGLSIPGDERIESRRKIRLSIKDPSQVIEEGEPPIFVRRLSDLAVKVGTRTRFLVEIRSSTSPKITWHKNDEPVQSGSRFSFVHEGNFYCVDVAPVMVDDQGNWTCMAENGAGRSSCTSFLNVIVPKAYKKPEFVDELRALLTETGTVSLECKVVGVPTPVLKWFKDQKEIKAGDVFALTANSDDPTSLGTYTCEAVNCMGTACSSSRVHVVGKGSREGSLKPADALTPSGPLPVFKKILRDEACKIGDSLVLSCQVLVPPWPKTITWYNKEGRVEQSDKYHVIEDGLGGYSIEIKGVEAMDEGEWKCVATSPENMKQFSTCYVAMSIPKNYRIPRFMESLKAVLTEEGLVSFECKVVGFPTPLLRWFKDGQELHPGDVYQLTGTNSLGSYCCIARNCMGEAKSIAELTVEDIQNQLNEEERMQLMSTNQAPKFVKGLRSCEARINEDFTFTIQVSVSPEPSLSWYRDDMPVIESEKYRFAREALGNCHLEVKKLEFMDQAEWKCVAANDFGHSVTSCFLKLVIPKHFKKPKFLESLRAILSEEGAVNLECKVIGVPQPVLKWYKDGVELKPGDIHRIISGQDGTCCLGTYTCEATNCMGSVSSSASLLGFEDRVSIRKEEPKETTPLHELARNLSLSTIHEERTSQLYDTPQTDHSITLDDRGEVSFSFDGKEVSVSLYETPDLTEEEALQIVEMYADQLSEHITEGNVIELPPMRFTKETSTTGNLLMEAVVIDVSPDYFVPDDGDDLRTLADVEDVSIMDDQLQSLRSLSYVSSPTGEIPSDRAPSISGPSRPPRRKESRESERSSRSERSERSEKSLPKGFDWSESYHSAKEPSIQAQSSIQGQDDSGEAFTDALSSSGAERSKAEESRDLYASFAEQTVERVPLDEVNVQETIASQIGEALIEQVPVKRKKKKKVGKGSRTPSLSSKASSEESYSPEAEEKGKRRGSKNGREKGERRGSASSNKSTGKTAMRSRSSSGSVKFESAASTDRRRRESDATIMVDDIQIEETEEILPVDADDRITPNYSREETEAVDERPASVISTASTLDSEKSMSKTNKERLLENVYKLSEPVMALRSVLVDLGSLLPLLQTQGSPAEVERSRIEITERVVVPIENLCEQVSIIETKALKSAGDRSLAQNVRISLLEAIGGPTEELLRGIELIRGQGDQRQDPKSSLIVLESLTDPVDEILVGLTRIEHELTTSESAESSLLRLEKPIALERMCRAVTRLGTNVEQITDRKMLFGDESASCSVIERLQSAYQSLEAFLSTVPLNEVSGTLDNNVDTLVVETLVRPLEELSRVLETFGTTDVRTTSDRETVVSSLERSMSEMSTRLEALTAALEIYEKESGERGITELHADLVTFLRYTMDDAVERLEKLKLKKKRVTQETRVAEETGGVTPMIFDGKSSLDGDEGERVSDSIVGSSETEESNVLQDIAQDAASIMKAVTVPSMSEAEAHVTPLSRKKSTKLEKSTDEKSTTETDEEASVSKKERKKTQKREKSLDEKKQPRTLPQLDADLPLPEMLLDPLIEVQANLSDVISDFESQESAEESSLPGGSELAACLSELRECVATAAHTATTMKSANTVNALVDLREPLLDLQLAMASAASPEEVKLIQEATVPLVELKVIVAAAIRSPETSEASQVQMRSVLRMLEDIEAEVSKHSEAEAISASIGLSPTSPEVLETRSVPQRPPEEVERAAVALTGVHFALSTALERGSAMAVETTESLSLPGESELSLSARQTAEKSAASNLIASIEELRQCVGGLAIAIATPVVSTQTDDQYSYDILFDELAKLEEPLLNLQKVLLTEEHGPEDRHVLNDVASPIRSLKSVVQDVTREIGGGATPTVLELIEDVEKDVTLIAMEALKKALAGKSEGSVQDGQASVSSSSTPGEVPAIISKWLDPIEDWLTSTAAEGAEREESRAKSAIAPAVDDLKRELLKIAIQTSYSEPPSDVALIESLTELQEPLAKVCRVIAECHEPENLDIVEGLVQPTKHLLGTIFDASLTHEAGKVLRPVLEAIEELENQIPLTIKRATYERELQRVVRSMTPEETHVAEETPGTSGEVQSATSVESSENLKIAATSMEVTADENLGNLSQQDFELLQARARDPKPEASAEKIAEESKVTVQSSEEKSKAASAEVTGEENLRNLSQEDFELLQARARDPKPEASAEKIAEESKVTVQSSEEKSKAASAEVTGEENLRNLSQEDFELLQARARDPKPEASAEKIAEESKVTVQSSEEKSKAASADVTGDENLRNLSQQDFELLQARARDPKPEASAEKIAEESKVTVQSSEEKSKDASAKVAGDENFRNLSQQDFELLQARARDPKPEASAEKIAEESKVTVQSSEEKSKAATTQVTGEDNAQPPSELQVQAQIFDAEKSAEEISGVSKVSFDAEKSSLQKMDLQINYPEDSKPLETTAGTSASEAAIIHAAEEKPHPSLPSETPEVITVDNRPFAETVTTLQSQRSTSAESLMDTTRADQLDLWTLTLLGPLDRLGNAVLSLDRSVDEEAHGLLCRPLDSLHKQIEIAESQFNRPAGQSLENDVETIIEGFLSPVKQLHSALGNAVAVWERGEQPRPVVCDLLRAIADSSTELCELLDSLRKKLVDRGSQQSLQEQQEDTSLVETINAVLAPLEDVRNLIEETLKSETFVDSAGKEKTEDSMGEERRHGPLEALAAVEEIRGGEEKTRNRDESAPVEQKAQSTEEKELARASVAKSESLAAAVKGEETLVEEELEVLLGRESETARFETAEEVVEKGMEENASIVMTNVAKTSRIGNKGKEESLDIEETTAKPLEELIEAIVDSSGPGRVSSSPEGYQSITPDISEDKSDTLIEEESMPDNELAKKDSTEVTSAQKVEELGIEEQKKDKIQALAEAGLAKEEIIEGVVSAEKAQKVVTEKLATSGEAEVGEMSEAERKIEALRLAEAILDEIAEEILGEVGTDDIQGEKAMSLTQEDLAKAEGRQKKSLILEIPKDSQEDVLAEDAKEIKTEELEGHKAELREGESLAEAGVSKAPEPRHRAMHVELLETSDQESLKEISTQELEKQKVELGEAEGLAEAKITDAPEMRIKARDAEVLEPSEEESLQEISTQELEKQKGELREDEGLAEAKISDAPEMRITARDAEITEASAEESLQEISIQELEKQKGVPRKVECLADAEITDAPEMRIKARDAKIFEASAEESLQEISTQELEKQKGELRETEGLAEAKITDAPEMRIKAKDAEISEASAEESLQEISTQELEKQKGELREAESLTKAKITDAPEMKIKARDAEISEASAEQSLQEISTQELEKQKGELGEAEGLAEAKITDAPEMRIKAKDAEISEASAEESLQEISTQELEKQKGELREAEGLAEAKITDAPEMRIKAKDAEISEASAEESLQEISTQELEKQKGELREAEGLAEAKITDAPEMRIKAKDAEISEASAEESLQEISTQKLEKQKGELREAEGLAEAKITDAPEIRIKAKDAEISEASAEESLQEISTQEFKKQKAELGEADGLAEAKITDAPEMRIKARDAEISEASAEESLQEISTQELEKQKCELREGDSLAKAKVTDAPETMIKAKDAEISEASDQETLQGISTEELETLKGELREGESLAKAIVTDAPEMRIKARETEISEASDDETLKEISAEELEKEQAELRESESLSKIKVTAAPETLRAGDAQISETTEVAESVREMPKEVTEAQLQKASISAEEQRHTAEIATIRAAEVAKLDSVEIIEAAKSTIVEIVETPTQKTFKMQREGTSGEKPEDIVEKIVIKPVEDVVAMEDQQIVEIVETPTEKVIKVKLAVERSDGVVEYVIEEIVVKKPVEGWAKTLIEEGEQQAASVSQAKIQEFVSATIPEEGVGTHTSQQQRSVDKDSEEVGKKESSVTPEETRESRKKNGEASKKTDEDKVAEVQKEETERSKKKEAEKLAREEQDRQEAERLKRDESERLKREEEEKLRKAEADKIEREESEKREMAKREAERLEREEAERLEREEAERLKRVEEERLRKEEAERLEREELERQEKVRQEAERLKREEAERLQREEEERLKREEAERLQREEEERLKREEAERLQREEEERLKREEAERLQREEKERLKREEAERLQREEEERLKREEAERLRREEEERLKREEAERLQREEAERLKREEAERLQREEEERLKREEAERLQREEEERLKREEAERLQREEEERLKREEAERLQREEEERLKRDEAERLQKEEEERLRREEAERLQREEEERLKREEAERLQRDEKERLKREEAERLQREEEERLKREEAERLQREEEERLKREEAERLQREQEERLKREEAERLQGKEEERLKREEAERLQREEEERLKREEAERLQREEEERLKRTEAERLQREEEERLKREEAERLQREEEERLKREEAERLQREEEERLKREEAERLQKEEEERRRKEEAERLRKEEADRLEKEELERKKQEAERVKKEEEERLKKEEAERLAKEELERKKQEEIDRAKKEEEERLKREEAERLEKEELEQQKKEAERLKQEELDRAKKEEEERLKREEAERLEKEKLERQKQEELERTRQEEEERVKKEEDERLKQEELERKKQEELAQAKKAEDERLKQEELERKKQEELAQAKKAEEDRLKKEEAERLEKEESERKKQDAERVKQEELERAKKEEEERLKQEEAEKTKQKEIERKKQEESERMKKEQEEHLKQEEAERNKREEAERVKQQELERAKKEEEEERLRKEKAAQLEQEEQNRKKEETERLKQEESERVKKEEEERLQKEESDCKKKEADRLKQEELERAKKEEDERLKKEEEERLKKDEAAKLEKKRQETEKDETERSKRKERRRSSKKEAERLKGEEDERQRIEETERLENEKLQRDKEEAERLKNEELERQQKEVAERLKEEEQEHRRREEVERIEKEEMQREQDAEAERLRNKKELKRQQKEEAKRLKKEDSKEEAKRSSRKSQKDETLSKDTETAQIQAASSTRPEEQDDEETPVNSEEEIREKANQRRVRVQQETEMDRDPRSSSTIRTDSEMDSEYSESSKSVVSRDSAVPARRRRSAQKQATEDDNDEVAKERLDRRGRDRPTIGRTREETLSSAEDKHYTPHYSATSRFQEFAPGPRDRGKKPSFCTKLTDRTAAEASRIKLTCAVLGDPEPQVYWTKDGRELPHSSNRHCTTEENGMISLELYAASPKDSGEYSCVAKNVHGQAHTEAKLKVYAGYEPTPAIPTFTRSIKDTYHSTENELVLECRVRGQPSPKITWLKDGQVLQIGDRYQQCDLGDGICRLKISNPDFYDGGLYTCRAENESKMSDRTSHVVNFEGKEREHSTGWRGSYRNLTSSDRDTGRPRFSSYLTDHSVPAGGTIALQVEVKGVPPPDVTWMRGDRREPIPAYKARTFADSGVYTLIVPEATESETGTYVCRASNAYGYVDTSANVEVVSSSSIEGGKPAMFVSRPAETMIHVTVGEDVSVSFRVNGIPKPRIIWMKGLRDITNGPRSYKESHDDYVRLTLKRALVSDEGTYCILAKNRYGCDRTFYTIKVKQRARSLTPSPDWGSLDTDNLLMDIHDTERSYLKQVPGAITSEPVVVDGGRNWLALSWGKAVQHGPAPVVAYRVDAWLLGGEGGARWAELGITPVNAFDAFNLRPGGEYKFRITPRNRYGWGDSVTMTNSVTVRGVVKFPEFSKILPGQLKALRGETLHLECEVRSETRAEVKWYRDTTDIDGMKDPRYMSYYNGTKSTLTVQAIKEHDSGRYVCEATNPAGRVSTFARVQVVTDPKIVEADEKLRRMRTLDSSNEERPPEFTMRLRDRRVQMTYPVRLTCQVSGHPEPEVTWYKNREELFQDDNVSLWDDESHFHTLEISHSTIDDSGVYMAKARNVNGSVSCRCNLVVDKGIRAYVAPEFFRHLDVVYTIKSGGELRMTAQIEAYPTVGIVWHRDGHRLRPSRNAVMTLNHDGSVELSLAYVTLRDAGLYCCTATNEVGRAESTTRVTVLGAADEEAPSLTQSLPDVVESLDVPYSKEPLFVTKPLSTEAVEGDTVIILCEVVGDPKPEVIWLRDFLRPDYYRDAAHFRRIGAGPQYRLEIPYAKLDFTGAYSVIAKNCHGEAKAVISLQIYARGQGKTDSMEQTTIKHGNVQTLPSIKRPLRDLRCCDGDAVTLICRVHATPEPDVRWEKSGKLVPLGEDFAADFDGETARLSIQHVYPEDEGEYTCVAYNDLGKAFTSACLIVDVPEGKESALSRRLIRPVGLLSAESTPISTPRSTPVRSLSPSCVASRRELKPAVRTPRGQSIGRRPRLPTGPKFYAVPHNRVAEEGETVRFQCAVAGHPAPWVTWDKDGIPVTPTARISLKEKDDVRILEITEITHEDAGLYRITLENDVGRTEATARLEIIKGRHSSLTRTIRTRSASPRTYSIYSRSPITSAIRGDTHLRPNINDSMGGRGGTLSPTLPRWHHRNGKPPIESPEPTRKMNKQQITLVKSPLKNGVTPAAKAYDQKTSLSSKPRSSSVPRQNTIPREIPIHVTKTRQTKASPVPRRTSEDKIRSNKNTTTPTMKTNGSMIPKRLPTARSRSPKLGNKIAVENPHVSVDSVDFSKTTTVSAVSVSKVREETVKPVQSEETLEPEILRNLDDELSKTKSPQLEELSPPRMSHDIPGDSSKVIAEDKNEARPPVIIAAPADVIALRGAKVILLATFEGEPQPRVRWLRKGRDVRNDDRAEIETSRGLTCLTLDGVTTEQTGKYAVTLENNSGRDCRYVNVTVEGVPDPPAGTPCVQSITRAGKAIVTWRSPPYDGGCAVTGYSVEMKRGDEPCWIAVAEARHSLSHTVAGLDPEETYRFRVRAENAHGVSEPSTVSEVVTVPGEDDEEIGGQVFVAEINQIEIEEEEEEFEPAFEARIVSPEDGRQFEERYDVLEELGKGRYGIVRRIVEKSSGLNLAAKFVRTIKAKDRQQVHEEICVMNILRHPKLLRLAAAFESPKEIIMVTEYISGGELFERVVADDFTLTEKDSIQFVKQICEGVEYMHAHSVVHLDLKPENIMCHTRTSHRIKLIDFGLAQTLKPDTPVRVLFGTPEFIPPEIIGFEPIGTESDMWSVGVICYVLLTGLSPFMGDNDAETFANITRAEYDFDDKAFTAISHEAKDFISALLIKRKESRMSAKQCLEHAWLAQRAESMSRVALPTDKLKKFIVRRKWQKTGNAIRALGRMAILSANSRRNLSAGTSPTNTEFGDELFADVASNVHGFKPIRPVVNVEDRTGSEYHRETSQETIEEEITSFSEEREESQPEIQSKSSDSYSNGLYIEANCTIVSEVDISQNPEESGLDEDAPIIEEMDDLIQTENEEKRSDNSEAELCIEEISNESYAESDITTDLDAKTPSNSYLDDTTRKQSFSSFASLKITETATTEVSSSLDVEESLRIETTKEVIEYDEINEEDNDKAEIMVFENEILDSGNITEDRDDSEGREATSTTPVVTKAWCKTNNPILVDEEDEIARLAGRARSRHIVRTGSVSRTAKMFEKEEESNSSPARQQNPVNRTTPMVPEGRPQNERIRKAFAFWNK